jgi:hypothetical protein
MTARAQLTPQSKPTIPGHGTVTRSSIRYRISSTMSQPNLFDGLFSSQGWDSPEPSQLQHNPASTEADRSSGAQSIPLLQWEDWDQEQEYNETPARCLHYSIEWRVNVNGKIISKDTEQDLVLAPAPFWQHFLQPKLDRLLRRKLSPSRCVKCDDTNVVVSVTERAERDLTR